jgi:hypothetical protein
MQPILYSWISASNCAPDYPRWMTKNFRHCIHYQFQDGALSVSLVFLRITVTDTSKKTPTNRSRTCAIFSSTSECNHIVKNLKTRTGDWNRRVWLDPVSPACWLIRVSIWTAWKQQVRAWNWAGTTPRHCSSWHPDHRQVTPNSWYY